MSFQNVEYKMEKKQIHTIFLFQFKLLKQFVISIKNLTQESLLNVQHNGGLRNFVAATKFLKMMSIVVSHYFHPKQGTLPLWCRGLLSGATTTGTLCRDLGSKMSVHVTLELLHVSTVGEAGTRNGIPKSSGSGEETTGVEGFFTSRDLYCVGVGFSCLSGLSRVFTSRGHKCLQFFRAFTIKILVEQAEGCNISSMGQWLKPRCKFRAYQIGDSLLNPVQERETSSRCTSPNMTAILHTWANGGFIEVQDTFGC